MSFPLFLAVMIGIVILLLLILVFRITAFLSLLIASIMTGLLAGQGATEVIATMQKGMASTLGFVATVVGLGAMFGAILEQSGGAKAIAGYALKKLGVERAPLAMLFSGFLIAIPVFFDVAFILLVPVIYALQKRTGKSLLLFAIPLLSGLAITHAFIPPTPGPVAVADILGANLGWVILVGLLVGIPTALVSGLWFGKRIAGKIFLPCPEWEEEEVEATQELPPIGLIIAMIAIPIFLILLNTTVKAGGFGEVPAAVSETIKLLGHPFSALIIANLLAWYFLGIRRGFSREQLLDISTKSMAPAGTIILLTGAGGVFKQVLVDTGAGAMIASSLAELGFPLLLFAFLAAALVRILQGSATVAMITAAGLVAPLLVAAGQSPMQLACLVISIAAGASILSHVNDSGFWLVSQYLGMTEKQTFRSWSVMTSLLAITGFVAVSIVYLLV